jgi:uncharacterized protein (TIGR01319 family)
MKPLHEMQYILATDVGSTTTKARFFAKRNGEWRFIVAGEAPTTVEAPFEDVTQGVRNAVNEIEELTNHRIMAQDGSGIEVPFNGKSGVDLYCTTSSAGGGLQMMVAGAMKGITAESANRAALGAGAMVMDVIATNDGRPDYVKIQRIRSLRPDMILLAGGTDGGTIKVVLETAEMIKAADPKPRLGVDYNLPLLYAGNKDATDEVKTLMSGNFEFTSVDNLRPQVEIENTEPARRAIHEIFMKHVMSHAPGYPHLMQWTNVDIMPTPGGEGLAMQLISKTFNQNVLGVGLGGATTNIYSIFDEKFVRSVSANLGMSYSIANVLLETGIKNIMRWLPFDIDEAEVKNRLMNKMIRPTIIPQTLDNLILEHAVAREALRLGLLHHKSIATRLKGVGETRDVGQILNQKIIESYIDMMKINIIAGTGGLLSHAPRREQSMLIMTDAFQPEGVTRIFQDSVFMMPHLGVLSTIHPEASWQIFDKDCLVRVGTVIAPVGTAEFGTDVLKVEFEMPDGSKTSKTLKFGEIVKVPLQEQLEAKVTITPTNTFDIGAGQGKQLRTIAYGGVVGIYIDARGRPLKLPEDDQKRKAMITSWNNSLGLYPEAQV